MSAFLDSYLHDRDSALLSRSLLDYDALSRSLYTTEAAAGDVGEPGTIVRLNADGAAERLVDSLAASQLAVMPTRALLFVASAYQIAAYRLTSSFERM